VTVPNDIVPLTVAIPLGAAALLGGADRYLGRIGRDVTAVAAAAATAVLAAIALNDSAHRPIVYWFGDWLPERGTVIGVDYVVDPMGGGLALLAALLSLGALVYSQRFFARTGARYPALVLVFLAASIDFAWTGDLFNLFVAFELVAVVGFILTGYFASEEAPLQGAINFAVTNTVGGLLMLLAVTVLYGYTGTLNLAQMGQELAVHRPDGVVAVALAMLCAGFLIKAAVVPWHFWLPDAYGAAPAPTCVIFAGVLSELGLFGLARVWETVFSAVVVGPAEQHIRLVFGALGVLTALVGTAMSMVETYGRRILGFVVVAHMGLYLLGFAVLQTVSLGGVALLAAGDGFTKAALFLAVGVLRRRRRETGGRALRGSGGRVGIAIGVVIVGALALADLPPFASSVGKDALVAGAGSAAVLIEVVFVITTVGTSGAILASAARVWRGEFPPENSPAEEQEVSGGTPVAVLLLVPAVVLLGAGLALGLLPDIAGRAVRAASVFSDRKAYVASVVNGKLTRATASVGAPGVSLRTLLGDGAEAAGAIVFAALLLSAKRLQAAVGGATILLRKLHSGHVADQVTWSLAGLAALAGLYGIAFR
jgi:multicomponent Na+:H+ antiporter subunit D